MKTIFIHSYNTIEEYYRVIFTILSDFVKSHIFSQNELKAGL